jgi:hypothetical protein
MDASIQSTFMIKNTTGWRYLDNQFITITARNLRRMYAICTDALSKMTLAAAEDAIYKLRRMLLTRRICS